jgi:hypothetical protein
MIELFADSFSAEMPLKCVSPRVIGEIEMVQIGNVCHMCKWSSLGKWTAPLIRQIEHFASNTSEHIAFDIFGLQMISQKCVYNWEIVVSNFRDRNFSIEILELRWIWDSFLKFSSTWKSTIVKHKDDHCCRQLYIVISQCAIDICDCLDSL